MDYAKEALKLHAKWNGKLETTAKSKVNSREDLAIAYTPGVAEPCKVIAEDKDAAYTYTMKANTVAVVSDGSAVLGLGNIGPYAAMPVMEGKAVLFKEFGGVNAIPICLDTQDTEEIIKTVTYLAPGFGGINLEDISAPRCFEIERRLKEKLDIPVFHDDQHGTAVVVGAALINAVRCAGKQMKDITVVINGAGAAGIAIGTFLLNMGIGNLIMVDINGIINRDDKYENPAHAEMAVKSNKNNIKGGLSEAMKGADVFIGVSKPGLVSEDMIKSMAEKPIVFAMANPEPEIMPDKALAAGAYIVGTGRSDFPNQINNVLVFPGIFKGALQCGAKAITEEMKKAAAYAIADIVTPDKLSREYIIPSPLDKSVAEAVATAVEKAAQK